MTRKSARLHYSQTDRARAAFFFSTRFLPVCSSSLYCDTIPEKPTNAIRRRGRYASLHPARSRITGICLFGPISSVASTKDNGSRSFSCSTPPAAWGRIGDKNQDRDRARDRCRPHERLGPGNRTGLMAYGHRREGDCRDIELLIPAGKTDPRRIVNTVNALHPKGQDAAVRRLSSRPPSGSITKSPKPPSSPRGATGGRVLRRRSSRRRGAQEGRAPLHRSRRRFRREKEERTGSCVWRRTRADCFRPRTLSELKAALVTAVKQAKQSPNVTIIAIPKKAPNRSRPRIT